MRLLTLSLTSALMMALPAAGYAAPAVDEATAQKLATEIDGQLAQIGNSKGLTTKLSMEGKTVVTPDGDGYQVKLPVFVLGTSSGDKGRSGDITGRLTPLEGSEYRYSFTLPSPLMTMYDITDIPTANVTLGVQNLTGTYDPETGFGRDGTFMLGDIKLTDLKSNHLLAALGRLTLTTKAQLSADGKISSRIIASAANLVSYDDNQREALRISGMGASYIVKGADFAAMQQIRENAKLLRNTAKPQEKDVVEMLKSITSVGGASGTALVVRDISLTHSNAAAGSTTATTWTLPLVKLGLNAESGADGMTGGALTYSHEGLTVSPAPSPLLADLLPASLQINGQIDRLPLKQLIEIGTQAAMNANKPETAEDTAPAASLLPEPAQLAVKALDDADAKLTVNNLSYGASKLTSHTEGAIAADANAKFGATGALDTRINGLDEVVASLSTLMQSSGNSNQPQAQPDPLLQNAFMALSMLQGFGQQVEKASPSARTYKLELTAEGGLKLNGTDFAGMLGMAGGMKPRAQ